MRCSATATLTQPNSISLQGCKLQPDSEHKQTVKLAKKRVFYRYPFHPRLICERWQLCDLQCSGNCHPWRSQCEHRRWSYGFRQKVSRKWKCKILLVRIHSLILIECHSCTQTWFSKKSVIFERFWTEMLWFFKQTRLWNTVSFHHARARMGLPDLKNT